MSGAPETSTLPVSTVPKARFVLWVAQWLALILVPFWLVEGTALLAGGGWTVFIMSGFLAPLLFAFLLIAALLSIGIRSARRSRGGPWYVWLLVGVWACVAVQPFLVEAASDSGPSPSALERLGLSHPVDYSLVSFFFWAAAVLLALAWISTGAAGLAPPFGDGSDRKVQQRRLRELDRLDELNRWRP